MQLDRGASDREVKKAFRQLSLIYHPDKNPDPAAAVYFRDSISKAYKALTGAHPAASTHVAELLSASHPCMLGEQQVSSEHFCMGCIRPAAALFSTAP